MSNIHETLAQLDDRLDDLRRQVARLTEEPAGGLGAHRLTPGANFSVSRLGGGPGATVQAPEWPDAPEEGVDPTLRPGPGAEIHELLGACERLLAEARELMGARGAEQARPAFFEGMVTLVARGADRLATIQVLEDSLSRAGQVTRVYLRRVQAGQVRFELTLTGGVDLVGELNRVMPFPFAVRSATREEVVISLEGEGGDL
ncbi:MAG TPA: hypothetical protein VE983_05815 [Solirubrobacteraceae bacterium]|nr:hypothetical protein [Solirubrobacteraceae bacterium]